MVTASISLTTLDFTVTCVSVISEKSFDQVTAAVEAQMGEADNALLRQLKRLDINKSFDQVQAAVEAMVGESGFTMLADYQLGGLFTSQQKGQCKRSKLYVIGNPLIASQMFQHHPGVGLYVPLRLYVYQDIDNRTQITYEKPSSLLGRFQNDRVLEVAQQLDQKLEKLVTKSCSVMI